MARNKPAVFVSREHDGVYQDACQAVGVYAVLYCGEPFTLRYQARNSDKFTYKNTVYTHPGNAHRLARTLNTDYNTDQFTVETFFEKP